MPDPTSSYARNDAWWPEYAPTEILPRLWQGGTDDTDLLGTGRPADHDQREDHRYPFDVVVTLYADANPVPWHVEELRFGFYDASISEATAERALTIARYAHARWQSGARVLVRCQAGVNRSGLVTALVLMLQGYEPAAAIELLREKRGSAVLINDHFVRFLIMRAPDMVQPR